MKFFLSVHEGDYSQTPVTRGRNEKPRDIDTLQFEELRQFYNKNVWTESQKSKWDGWLTEIPKRNPRIQKSTHWNIR